MNDISRWVSRHADFTPDKPAIHFEGETLSYLEFDRRIAGAAQYLADDLGLGPGDVIAYLGANTPEQLILTFAAARAGLLLLPLNWRLAGPEQAEILANAGARALFAQEEHAARASEIANQGCRIEPIGWQPGEAGAAGRGALSHPLLLVYTSGTTGRPKGAVLSQGAVLYNALNAVHMHGMTSEDHVLTVLPMFHVGGLNIQTLPAFYCGATVTLQARFDPAKTLEAISKARPTLTVQVPATLKALLGHKTWEKCDLGSLRAISTGSTDVPVPLIEAIHERGVPVIQVYGSTETGPVAMYQRIEDAMTTVGSIGRTGLHSEIRLVDEAGEDVPDGEAGEIIVAGAHVAQGYWKNPIETQAAFRDGWFHSGDIARQDKSGLFWFQDRAKNVIISGGENVYPAELERVLVKLPGVAEAAVLGRADERWGEVPVAVVVRSDPELQSDTVLAAFEGRLARYKHPKDVLFADALPRNVMGKVDLEALRELVRR